MELAFSSYSVIISFMKDVIHSITAMVWAINLSVYYYIKHMLAELLKVIDKDGKIEQSSQICLCHDL